MLRTLRRLCRPWGTRCVQGVLLSALAIACSSESSGSVAPKKDAGQDASSGGSGGQATGGVGGVGGGTGGSSDASAGSGGSAGTGGSAGSGGSVGDASTDASTGGTGGTVDAGACPNGVQGGDGTVGYPRWALPAGDSRAASEFTQSGDTALDHATCLMWQTNVDATARDWAAADTYCQNLGVGGHTDWRLPTRAELISLTDFTTQAPATVATVFPGTTGTDKYFWSNTKTAENGSFYWAVSHGGVGQVSYLQNTASARVRCVRGAGAPSPPRFDATSIAGAVKDKETGLLWEAAPKDADVTQPQAKTYCDQLINGGFNDWRLPTARELQTLIDPEKFNPALPTPEFTTALNAWYWSSTLVVTTSNQFWAAAFNTGFSQPETSGNPYINPRVRCVR
ncbi:MAG: DUF1566 domain-containing protein [Polyangiaceae bacterium]